MSDIDPVPTELQDTLCRVFEERPARARLREIKNGWGALPEDKQEEANRRAGELLDGELAWLARRSRRDRHVSGLRRDYGVSSDALIRWVLGGEEPADQELPHDLWDLAACVRAADGAPGHLEKPVLEHLWKIFERMQGRKVAEGAESERRACAAIFDQVERGDMISMGGNAIMKFIRNAFAARNETTKEGERG